MSTILEQFGGADTTERIVRGRISKIDGDRVYATIPSFNSTHEFGPFANPNTSAVVIGDSVLIGFDEVGDSWLISWNGVAVASGAAGGALTGTYPNPEINQSHVHFEQIDLVHASGEPYPILTGNWPYLVMVHTDIAGDPAGGAGISFMNATAGTSYDLYIYGTGGDPDGILVYKQGTGDYLLLGPNVGGSGKPGIEYGRGAGSVKVFKDASSRLKIDGDLGVKDLYGGPGSGGNFAIVGGDGGTSTCRILTYVSGTAYERLKIDGTTVRVLSVAGVSPALSVDGRTSIVFNNSAIPHLSLGKVSATDGQNSASIQLAGFGVDHQYIISTPSVTAATRRIKFARNGGDDPGGAVAFAQFGGDDSLYLGSGTDVKLWRSAAGVLSTNAALDAGGISPLGAIQQYAGASDPADTRWIIADGRAISRTTYAALFALISTTYGIGDGSTTFNVPNLKGRVPVGRDAAQAEFDVLGETGGAKTVALSVAEMPSHSHTVNSHDHGGGNHNHGSPSGWFMSVATGANFFAAGPGADIQGFTNTANSGNTIAAQSPGTNTQGSGTAHNNLQPYIVLNYIIRIA